MSGVLRLFWFFVALAAAGLLPWSTQRYLQTHARRELAAERVAQLKERLVKVQQAAKQEKAYQNYLDQVHGFEKDAVKYHVDETLWIRYQAGVKEQSMDGPTLVAYLKAAENSPDYYFQPESLVLTGRNVVAPDVASGSPDGRDVKLSFSGSFLVRRQP